MKMILKDEYDKVDAFMSDANAGGRKGRRVQDHLFLINGIIFEHARNKSSTPISIGIYDCEQCFDSLWQDEVINNLYDAGLRNDKLALLQKINHKNKLAITTHDVLSQRKDVEDIICQGDSWGPIECSLQVDEIGKESLHKSLEPYRYKDIVEIPALGWIDDIITVSESGHKTARLNAFINAQLATKKLCLGARKCYTIHIGSKHDEFKHVPLYVDGCSVRSVESNDTGSSKWEEILDKDMKEISHHQNEDSTFFCFMAQLRNPTKGDWVTTVMEEMDELEIGLQLDDIKNMTKNSFRKIVKEKVQQKRWNIF